MQHLAFQRHLLALILLVSVSFAGAGPGVSHASAQSDIQGPFVGEPVYPAVVDVDVRDLPQAPLSSKPSTHQALPVPLQAFSASSEAQIPEADPATEAQLASPNMPSPLQSFAGLDWLNWGAGWPPDTNGDVGPTHYIQTVNTAIGIFTKSNGALVAAFTFDDFFLGTGTPCDASNMGDPVVLYDPLADRWVITDFAWSNTLSGPYYECVAVSQSGNPVTGGWYMYGLRADDASHPWLNDYPKLGVWPDGYYMSANMFDCLDSSCSNASFQGARVWALNRTSILSGGPLTQIHFDLPSYGALLPSNLRGTAPPAGSPNYFAAIDTNVLRVWKFHVDWNTPANSTFTGPTNLTTSFTFPSAGVPQQGSGELLDPLGDRLMMQLQYRNINGTESLWANHTVARNGVTGVRWYEVRNLSGTASIFQQGTYQPDAIYRWMGSLAVDRNGNMAVGYSASSSSMFPAIRYAGRLASDALGTLAQGEATLIAGTGSQSGGFGRWGDYSAMSVDPVDDCTFWYTTEYYITTGSNWQTRIGSFKFPSCSGSSNTAPVVSAGPDQTISLPNSANLDGTVTDDGLPNPPGTVTSTWSQVSGPGTVTFGNPNAVDTTASFSAQGAYVLRLTANDSALSSSDDVNITVNPSSPDLIFKDGFESCNLSAWSGAATGGGDLSATNGAALVGTCGMQAVVNDNTVLYVWDTTPTNESRYRARFYINPHSIGMASADTHYLLQGLTGAGTNVFTVQLNNNTGTTAGYRIRTQVFNDAGSATNGTYFSISNATHFIEIDWQAASAAGANNGYITLWIDDVQKYTSPGIDNDTRRVEEARLGAVAGIDAGTRGTYYFDAFESRRQTYIGPAGTPNNTAPVVNAGPDQTISLPANANLDGTVTDDGLPNPPATVTTTWSKVSGPGTVTFGNPNAVDTTASFSVDGLYTLRLTANDSALSSSDDINITVNPPSNVPNDDFGNAAFIADTPYTNAQDTSAATSAADDPPMADCGLNAGLATVWYSFAPATNRVIQADTIGSAYDTVLSVWIGSRGNLFSVACDDDSGGNLTSSLTFYAFVGTTYYIEVAQFNGAAALGKDQTSAKPIPPQATLAGGSLVLNVVTPPPPNDDFDNATLVNSNSYDTSQDTSAGTTSIDDPVYPCGSLNQGLASVWFRFTPSTKGTLDANTIGSNYDTMLAIWSGTRGGLTNVACDDDSGGGLTSALTVNLNGGTTYYIEVAQFGSGAASGKPFRSAAVGGSLVLTLAFTPDPMDFIFADSFEADDCLTSPWSACVHDNFDLSFNYPPLVSPGGQSMTILIDDNNVLHVTSDHPNAESRYRARFYFDPNSITMVNGDLHRIFYGYNGTTKVVLRIEFRRSNNLYQLRVGLLTDGSAWRNSTWFTISDALHPVEIDWRAATAAGANNGGLTLWIDGTQKANLTGVDNDTWRIDRVRLGPVNGIDTGTRGTYYFDAFVSQRQSYIGP